MDRKIVSLIKDKEKSLDKTFEDALLKQVLGDPPKKEYEFIDSDGFILVTVLTILLFYFIFQMWSSV